ncbi:unnamed protein product [Phytomonas sp. Hart1]|nr:unnamed protein product [Phytomonas sp. Hart1]|eukprot:CCW72098.1 unnamed protein product [Phytomonas sp. isolate Hart1]
MALDVHGTGCIEEAFGIAERVVAVFGEQLLRGVRDMHERHYIHRDIKPGNVLVNEHGVVKLSDFGLSQRCDPSGMGIVNRYYGSRPRHPGHRRRGERPPPPPPPPVLTAAGGGGRPSSRPRRLAQPSSLLSIDSDLSLGLAGGEADDGMDVLDASSTASSASASASSSSFASSGGKGDPDSPSDRAEGARTEEEGDILCSGTILYMSPERQRGEPHGKPSDIWAVGITLAEFAAGEYPYDLEGCADDFDRMQRMGRPIDLSRFNLRRYVPLSSVFQDFIGLATLPVASQRPTAGELLEHPFFRQWSRPFYLKEYLHSRVPMPSNKFKEEYLAAKRAAEAAKANTLHYDVAATLSNFEPCEGSMERERGEL